MVSTDILALWLGLLVLLAVGVSLLPFRIEPTSPRMGIAGFFSGFLAPVQGLVVPQWHYYYNTKKRIN